MNRTPSIRLSNAASGLRLRGLAAALAAATLAGCVVAPPRHRDYGAPPPRAEPPAAAAPMYFYPERGQGEAQQDRDRYECYRWAVRETGIDPGMRPVQRTLAPSTGPVAREPGSAVAGAMAGAAVGGVLSSPRNTGAGLVLGAIFGSVLGAAAEENRAQSIERQQDARRRDWEARQAPVNDFRRAIGACMSGRGYAVR
ncbi:MAG: hypothetical protein ABI574_02900 [Burkholderiales bacterium]